MENGNNKYLKNGMKENEYCYEFKMYHILKKLQKTYFFYTKVKSFSELYVMILGICISVEEYLDYSLSLLNDFQDFLVKEFNIPNGPMDHWTKFILQGRSESEAFDYFFELLDLFIKEKPVFAEKPKEFADPYEEKLYEILGEIKVNPKLYMETPSISKLNEIISTIHLTVMRYLAYPMTFYGEFQLFIAKKYGKDNDPLRRWDECLLEGRTEEAAFDLFFEELDLFLKTRDGTAHA